MAQISIHKAIKLLLAGAFTCLRCLWSNIHQYQERMLLPGSLTTDWQLKAVFCEQHFSWEFAQMTWAPRVASGLVCDVEQNHNFLYCTLSICRMGLVPPHHLCKHLGARESGKWAGVMLTSSLQC